MLPRFPLHPSLFFALISTSIWVAAHTDPKINEFSDYDWYGSISTRTLKIFIAKANNSQATRLPTVTHLWSPNVSASTTPLYPSILSSSSRSSSLTNLKLLLTKNPPQQRYWRQSCSRLQSYFWSQYLQQSVEWRDRYMQCANCLRTIGWAML